jgi:exosome complex component RRP4
MGLSIEDKSIVVPGEILAEGMDYLPGFGAFRQGENIYSSYLGLVSVSGRAIKIVPLSGVYQPKKDDVIIGKVVDVLISGWRMDTNSAYTAVLPVKDATSQFISKGANLTRFFDLDDYVVCKITRVTSQNLIDVSCRDHGLKKIKGGRLIAVQPSKVPRIIGKQGSMVNLIKDYTGCRITVGQNGRIWILGDPDKELITVNTIKKIEVEAHLSGLTDIIKEHLIKECGEIKATGEAKPAGEAK